MTALNRKLDTVTVSMNYVELNNFVSIYNFILLKIFL